jgi:hypothetical protein
MNRKPIETIVLANQKKSIALETEIENILEVLGFPGSLVTDLSEIGDFIDIYATEEEKEMALSKIEEQFGVTVDIIDYIVDVAERIKRVRGKK